MDSKSGISVCLAAYNGARYIRGQIASILPQLLAGDEVVVVDDASTDETVAILDSFQDDRIRIVRQDHNCRVLKTFEHALREARGDVIFLCDQDDIWMPEKVDTVMHAFKTDPSVTLVLSNGELIDSDGRSMGRTLYSCDRVPLGVVSNLIKNHYQGSAMAFRKEILEALLPFPKGIPMHDSWIGLGNAIMGCAAYLPDKLILYRQHDKNVSKRKHGTILRMIAQRFSLMLSVLFRLGVLLRVRRRLQKQVQILEGVTSASF